MQKFIFIVLLLPNLALATDFSVQLAPEQHLTYQGVIVKNESSTNQMLPPFSMTSLPLGLETCLPNSTCNARYKNTCTVNTQLQPTESCHIWFHAQKPEFFTQQIEQTISLFMGKEQKKIRITMRPQLFAAGDFTSPGNHIARWDGAQWWPLGEGLSGASVDTLVEYQGDIVAGGDFYQAGNHYVNFIARWNGKEWYPLGDGVSDPGPAALSVYADSLFVGGGFDQVDAHVDAHYLASFFDERWAGYQTNLDEPIMTLLSTNKNLYAGGTFTQPINHIGAWQHDQFIPLGLGLNDTVLSLAAGSNNTLYAGGKFTASGAVPLSKIAQWDTQKWQPLNAGLNDTVMTLSTTKMYLYAGGRFTGSAEHSLNRIAQWDGYAWKPLSGGVFYAPNKNYTQVNSIAGLEDIVFVGGYFTQALNHTQPISANYVAQWQPTTQTWRALGIGANGLVQRVLALPELKLSLLDG